MDNVETILVEIKEQLVNLNSKMANIEATLAVDRANMWKCLSLVIIGAFALIGIKLVF